MAKLTNDSNNQTFIPSTDDFTIHTTLKMIAAQVVETSVNNGSFQNYTNPQQTTQQTTDTPELKPFTNRIMPCTKRLACC